MNLKIKTDKTSWIVLSVAIISLILCIIAFAAGKHTYLPLIGFSFVFFQVFYDRLKEIKRSSYDGAQRNLLSDKKVKPELDKYEITLFTIIFSIFIVVSAGLDGFLINHSFIMPLTIVGGALLLMGIAYHIDRKNNWEKQKALTSSTLQN